MTVAGTWFEYWCAIGEFSSSSTSSPWDKSSAGAMEGRGRGERLGESVAEGSVRGASNKLLLR